MAYGCVVVLGGRQPADVLRLAVHHFLSPPFLPLLNRVDYILPYEGQADKWSVSARERYYAILEQADSVEYVNRAYRDGCMIDRNHRLVEASDFLLAVYNGVRRSGTGATVNYARKLGREIIVINLTTLQITHESPAYDVNLL